MTLLAQVRGQLHGAAERRTRSRWICARTQLVGWLVAQPDRERSREGATGRSGMRVAVTVALLALVTAAVAVAGSGLLFGSPVPLEERLTPTVGWGEPIASSVKLTGLSVSDPVGGLPWGLRILRTTRAAGCLQVGRLSGGQLWVLGQDGAFRDDGRLHELPTDVLENEDCIPLDARGQMFLTVAEVDTPASGYNAGCVSEATAPPRPHQCPVADERALFFGALGPQARSITYATAGRTVTTPTVGPEGAYLIVTHAVAHLDPYVGGPGSANGAALLPHTLLQPIRSIEYSNGYVCHIAAHGDRDDTGRPCVPPGYERAPLATSAAAVRAPVTVALRTVPSPAQPSLRDEVADVSFTARVAVTRVGEYYRAGIKWPCGNGGFESQPSHNVSVGQRVEIQLGLSGAGPGSKPCAGVYRGRVVYLEEPLYYGAEAGSRPARFTVGKFSIRLP